MHKKMITILGLCTLIGAFFCGASSVHAATTRAVHISIQQIAVKSARSHMHSHGDPSDEDAENADDDSGSTDFSVINKKFNKSTNNNNVNKSTHSKGKIGGF